MPPQPLSASGSTPTPGTTRPEALLPCPLHRRFQSIDRPHSCLGPPRSGERTQQGQIQNPEEGRQKATT